MAGRRVWSALSQSYRTRLQRNGITKAQYESGMSLKAARGHAQTPESPREYARNPNKFTAYRNRRLPLAKRIAEKKERVFRDRIRFNEKRSTRYVKEGAQDVKPPTLAQLRFLDGLSDEEFDDFQYEHRVDEDWNFLWYK